MTKRSNTVTKTKRKGAAPHFPTAPGGSGVRVTPKKGGHNLGTPKHCAGTRGHFPSAY
jgi:hypothetical protein